MTDNQQYEFLSQVLVRTPFYSFRDYAPANLGAVLQREDFRNALWLASMDFYRLLEKKGFDLEKLDARARHTLLKYYNRMSFRPTPFGSFAAFTLAPWTAAPGLRLARQEESLLHLLPSLARKAAHAADGPAAADVPIAANPTLYPIGKEWRYTRSEQEPSGKLTFTLQAIDANPVNNRLIGLTARTPGDTDAIIRALTGQAHCTEAEAADYLAFLLQEQVLLSANPPGLVENPEIPAADLNSAPGRHTAVKIADAGKLSRFDALQPPFYAGLERPADQGGIAQELQQELLDALGVLARLVPQFASPEQQEFIKAFKAKFDSQKVPLLQALDPDTGISYGRLYQDNTTGHLLENIRFPAKGNARRRTRMVRRPPAFPRHLAGQQ
jgi:hypothetical protein